MKKLFTFVFAIAASMASFAQAPADWKVGDNVAAALGLGDVDGTSFSGNVSENSDANRPHDKVVETLGDYWKVDGDMPNEFLEYFDGHIGIYGFYDKNKADMYQVVKFPAGSYTVDVQALYREGTPADNFTNHFNKKYMKYGHLYADCLTSEDPNSTVTRNFDCVLRSLATSEQHESVYFYGDNSWMNDFDYESKEVDEEGNKIHYYCPQCLVGLSEYFALDKYHNTMKIVVTEDTYVRLGFRKTGYITADWLVFTNLQVIYNGPADDAAKIDLAKEEFAASLSNLEDVMNDVIAAGFEGLSGIISDAVMNANDEVDAASTEAEIVAVKVKVDQLVDGFSNSLQFVKNLADLLSQSEAIIASTDFPGIDAFKAAYATADAAAKASDIGDDDPAAYYQEVYNTLSKERADYLNTQEKDASGAKDFTSLVKNPWFVNPEYTPTHNDDGTWTLTEETWNWGNVGNPNSYANAKNGRTDIASDVVLAPSNDVTNQWYKANRYTSGWSSGIALYYQSGLIGVSDGWNSLSVGTIGIEQQLVGLPNGYYSLKGLVRGNNGDVNWDGKSREIFAQNSSDEIVVSETVKNDGDRPNSAQYGWYEWNPNAWADVKTAIISALDGKLLIGGRTSKVANFTGFRLYFYGEEVDFNGLIIEDIDKVKASIEDLAFAGDKAKASELLALVQTPVVDGAAYEVALQQLADARNYISTALQGEKAYKALDVLTGLSEYDFVTPAYDYALNLGSKDTDTYELVEAANAMANAYSSYCEVYDRAVKLGDAAVDAVIAQQTAEMKAEKKEPETIFAYMDALALPYNIAMIKSVGGDNASEANPVEITILLQNPTFEKAAYAKAPIPDNTDPTTGWSGETPTKNEYARGNAELWNKGAFTLSQKIVGLPAGKYELRARALYRDATAVTAALVEEYEKAGGEENWANHNAQLFMKNGDDNDQFSYIKAIESLKSTQNSFTYVANGYDTEEQEDGSTMVFATSFQKMAGTDIPAEEIIGDPTISEVNEGGYPLDTKIGDYYYPASMYGFYMVCKNNPEAYNNSVQITVTSAEGNTVELGFRKTAAISQDWVIFDDVQLFYLGGANLPDAIQNATASDKVSEIYSANGTRVNALQKGVNIVKTANGEVKKVVIK